MTPKQDAKAVIRGINRIERLKAQLAEAERDLVPHANRLSFAKGYRVPLRGKALRDLAEVA